MSMSIGSLVGGVLPPRDDTALAAADEFTRRASKAFPSGVFGTVGDDDGTDASDLPLALLSLGVFEAPAFTPELEPGVMGLSLPKNDMRLFCFIASGLDFGGMASCLVVERVFRNILVKRVGPCLVLRSLPSKHLQKSLYLISFPSFVFEPFAHELL